MIIIIVNGSHRFKNISVQSASCISNQNNQAFSGAFSYSFCYPVEIKEYGQFKCIDGNNDVNNGIQEVTKYINLGLLQIHKDCTETKKEFETYAWDDKAVEDTVIKESDHHMDLIRYFIYTIARKYNRWYI